MFNHTLSNLDRFWNFVQVDVLTNVLLRRRLFVMHTINKNIKSTTIVIAIKLFWQNIIFIRAFVAELVTRTSPRHSWLLRTETPTTHNPPLIYQIKPLFIFFHPDFRVNDRNANIQRHIRRKLDDMYVPMRLGNHAERLRLPRIPEGTRGYPKYGKSSKLSRCDVLSYLLIWGMY